jgi:hypothetical protein
MRAWAGILPPPGADAADDTDDAAVAVPESRLPARRESQMPAKVEMRLPARPVAQEEREVVEARWVTVTAEEFEPDVAPEQRPAADVAPLATKRGTARPADKPPAPEPLDASTEREILWYAEEHGVGAAAEKFGLSRQRITAMRARYERERQARKAAEAVAAARRPADRHERSERAERPQPRSATPTMRRPTEEQPARGSATRAATAARATKPAATADPFGASAFTPLEAARASMLAGTYGAGKPAAPAPTPDETLHRLPGKRASATAAAAEPDAINAQALAIAQALAAQFGVKVKAPAR